MTKSMTDAEPEELFNSGESDSYVFRKIGVICQDCGTFFEDLIPKKGKELLDPPRHPRSCDDCRNNASWWTSGNTA